MYEGIVWIFIIIAAAKYQINCVDLFILLFVCVRACVCVCECLHVHLLGNNLERDVGPFCIH
jgi:hypothetical protein